MEFPYGEQKNLLDVGEVLVELRKSGFEGRVDDQLRERLGGGSNEKINPYKRAAISIHEEAVRYRCNPPEFLLDILTAYLGRYEERGWRRAQRDLEERDATISSLREKIVELEKTNQKLESNNTTLQEGIRAAQLEHERILARAEERENATENRIQEALMVKTQLRKELEQTTTRTITQGQALDTTKKQLDLARAEIQQLTAKSQEMTKELAASREEQTTLRVQREADLGRLQEYQAEMTHQKTRESIREDEIRRLNDELRTAERREVEANQHAASLKLEVERLRGQIESGETRRKPAPKNDK